MKRVDVVYAFIYDEKTEKVLMVNNRHSTWSLPGGAVEKGETLEQAVIRETREETGLIIKVEQVLAVNEAFFTKHGHHGLMITFSAKIKSGEITINDKTEIAETKWMDTKNANKLMPYYPGGIDSLLKASIPYVFQGNC